MQALLERLGDYVKQNDPMTDPNYGQVAGLLAEAATEAQRHDSVFTQLARRADQVLASQPQSRQFDTQADWCEDILKRAAGPLGYSQIAQQMYEEGYQHGVVVKNPSRQLRDSIWVAMNEDPRFVKVGRGLFDLADRHSF